MTVRVPTISAVVSPCAICLGLYGQHDWRHCPARCAVCNGQGHKLIDNHPAGHIDAHHYASPHDRLRDVDCTACSGTRIESKFQSDIQAYKEKLKAAIADADQRAE
jgi:hypothetical protein